MRRARGALPADRVAALEAHLESCDSCRAYRDGASRLDAVLDVAEPAPPAASWDRLRRRVWWTAHAPYTTLGLAIIFLAAAIVFVVWLRQGWLVTLAMLFAAWQFASLPERIVALRDRRRVLAELAGSSDLLAFYRSELERGLKHAFDKGFAYCGTALTFLAFAGALWLGGKDPSTSLAFAGGCTALTLYWWLVRRPWLRRHAAEVDA